MIRSNTYYSSEREALLFVNLHSLEDIVGSTHESCGTDVHIGTGLLQRVM